MIKLGLQFEYSHTEKIIECQQNKNLEIINKF